MRIAYVYQFLTLGGVCAQLANRMVYFKRRGVEASCFFLYDRGGSRWLSDLAPVTVDARPRRLVDKALATQPDVLVTIDTPQVHADLERTRAACAWINEVHSTTRISRYVRQLDACRSLSGCLVPSHYMKDVVTRQSGMAPERIEVVANAIDTERFSPIAISPNPAQPIVCWVGKLDRHKNWSDYVAIGSELAQADPGPRFWLIGGATGDDRVTRHLLDAVNPSPLAPRFAWIDRVEYDAMPRLYSLVAQSGGILLITSTNESFGMTAMEAMCCGCPVVSSRVGALPELVVDGETGALYAPGDVRAGKEAAARMLHDAVLRTKCIAAARIRVVAQNGLRPVGERYLRALQRLIAKQPAG